ncbi:O-linked-mannose beta-1,2-N-acetylglucosaminyltransferase 1 [Paramuricea clavata]|uniref:O-linked-mannose beta-1,2-N-acetylglucosaminyltransferase 1 n=1 Tax=Paramuricea clavata TaxID=317549 RepID=A0A7D9L3T9_PARCT|nr:O-linked-mannose beta-1,2-N-acetylglucosaminyltransferase 1 [Paramuricea clavata]
MIAVHERGNLRDLKDWIEYCAIGDADKNCVSVVLDYFVEKGIIGKESKWFGMKRTYPTKDKEPQIQLLLEVRRITLRDEVPDGFMSALLIILRFADSLHNTEDPLLRRYYNDTEYDKAKPRLDEILRSSGIKVS